MMSLSRMLPLHHPISAMILYLLCFISLCTSTPLTHKHPSKSIANGIDLRILPLGDSITWGEGSSDGNGYRLALSNLITNHNDKLEYIGSVKSGSMTNNENEGHGGFTITAVGETGQQDYPLQPNVVLFMAGTNDIVFDVDLVNALKRLATVIEEILTGCPNTAVLVGSLLPLINPGWLEKINDFNSALPGTISEFQKAGKHVALVDMSRVNASHIQGDGIHPTDDAYALIAAAWYDGLLDAGNRGWINAIPSESEQGEPHGGNDSAFKLVDDVVKGDVTSAWASENTTWIPTRILIYALLTVGILFVARKAAFIFVRRYKG